MAKTSMADRRKTALRTYRSKRISVEKVLENTIRIAGETVKRMERSMFTGDKFVDDPNGPEARPNHDTQLVKDLNALSRTVVQLVNVQAKAQALALKDANSLTAEEEFQLAVNYVKGLVPADRIRFEAEIASDE